MKATLLFLFSGSLLAQVPGPISLHAPCTQTLYPAVNAYSGPLAISGWQLGFVSVNVLTGAQAGVQWKNGVWRAMLGGCSGRSDLEWNINDCWQSVATMTASNGSPKWLLATDAPSGCGSSTHPVPPGMNGLMVWKWNGTAFDVVNLIQPPSGKKVRELGTPVLAGDVAWVELANPLGWVPCDLNAMTCNWTTPQSVPPPGEGRQANVNGSTYNVGIDYSHPNVDGGPQWFWMTRADQPTPTRPPVPTATRTVTGGGARTATKTPTYNPCPPFCDPTATRTPSARTASPTPTRTASPSPSPTATTSRFSIGVTWTKPDGSTGVGTPSCSVASSSGDSSSGFWFFSPANTELYVSVLPSACAQHGHVWVKAMGATNVRVQIGITDRQTGATWAYDSCPVVIGPCPLFPTQIDTAALPCGGTP